MIKIEITYDEQSGGLHVSGLGDYGDLVIIPLQELLQRYFGPHGAPTTESILRDHMASLAPDDPTRANVVNPPGPEWRKQEELVAWERDLDKASVSVRLKDGVLYENPNHPSKQPYRERQQKAEPVVDTEVAVKSNAPWIGGGVPYQSDQSQVPAAFEEAGGPALGESMKGDYERRMREQAAIERAWVPHPEEVEHGVDRADDAGVPGESAGDSGKEDESGPEYD